MKFLVAIALCSLLYPLYVVHKQLSGHKERIEKDPSQWGATFEDILYRAEDGVVLRGWWVRGESDRAVLLLHGKGGSRNGYHCGIFDLGRWYWRRGYSVMMVDLRAHGESGGHYTTLGLKEHRELLAWLEKIDPDHRYRWCVHGFSMGAVTAMMMRQKAPTVVERVVADAPWIDFGYLAMRELRKRAWLPPTFYSYVRWIAETFFGQNFDVIDNRERVRSLCKEPVLYLFEGDDTLLGSYHADLLHELCSEARIERFDGLDHVEAFKERPQAYTEILRSYGL